MSNALLEDLYLPLERDQQLGLVQRRLVESVTAGTTSTQVSSGDFFQVPVGYVHILTNICVYATAGSGQVVKGWRCRMENAYPIGNHYVAGAVPGLSQNFLCDNSELSWLMMPGENLLLVVEFDAGTNQNDIHCTAHGFRIPKANIQEIEQLS